MVDRKDPLPVKRQCALLDLPRSTYYHVPKPVSDEELALMALIDRCHLKHPFYGSRRIRDWLEDQGHQEAADQEEAVDGVDAPPEALRGPDVGDHDHAGQ